MKYIDKNCYAKKQLELCRAIKDEVFEQLRKDARNGVADANYLLGWKCCAAGDEDGAIECFHRGAENGGAYSQFAYARYLHDRAVTDSDRRESFLLLVRAAPVVGVPAYWEMAMMILEGDVDRPIAEALAYLKLILDEDEFGMWDELFGDVAAKLLTMIPAAMGGDSSAMISLYKCLAGLEIQSEAHDEPFVFGVNSWIRGGTLGHILTRFEDATCACKERQKEVRQALKELNGNQYWLDDMAAAAEKGSSIAKELIG